MKRILVVRRGKVWGCRRGEILFTIKGLADEMGVYEGKVRGWIKRGEMKVEKAWGDRLGEGKRVEVIQAGEVVRLIEKRLGERGRV